jgi:peptide deformylase
MENDNSVYKILYHPNSFLKQKLTREVHNIQSEEKEFAAKMLRTMYAASGVGLSANQVGLDIRLIVYDAGEGERVMFNPFITKREPKKVKAGEGCLSFPKLYIPIQRSETILVRYRNLDNIVCEEVFSGLEARIIQHEIDHLDGKVFTERK